MKTINVKENTTYLTRMGEKINIGKMLKNGLFLANNSGHRYYSDGSSTAIGWGADLIKQA